MKNNHLTALTCLTDYNSTSTSHENQSVYLFLGVHFNVIQRINMGLTLLGLREGIRLIIFCSFLFLQVGQSRETSRQREAASGEEEKEEEGEDRAEVHHL